MTVAAEEADFRLTAGTPKLYVKTAESGAKRAQAFCADCGSPIYATSVGDGPKTYGLRVGTIRQRQELAPARQVWRRSALPWVPGMDDLDTHDGAGLAAAGGNPCRTFDFTDAANVLTETVPL